MNTVPRVAAVVLAAGLIFGAAGSVQAQAPGQAQGPAQPQGSNGGQRPNLATLLHLRPDQQGALQAYQAATQPSASEMAQMRSMSPQAISGLTTPQRLDRIGMYLKLQQQRFQRSADATRAFYAQLTPTQQHTYDQLTAPPSQGRGAPQN